MLSNPKDIKSETSLRAAITPGTSVAVASSGVAMSGAALLSIDRQGESTWPNGGGTGGPANAGLAMSAVFSLRVDQNAATVTSVTSVTAVIKHSSDQSTWTNYVPPTVAGIGSNPASLVAGTACGLATQLGCTALATDINIAVDLSQAKRYIQIVPTPTFAGSNSSVFVTSYCELGGFEDVPVQTPTNP